MRWALGCFGIAYVACIVVFAWMSRTRDFDPPPCLPAGFHDPILAIELPQGAVEVSGILRDPESEKNRQVFRDQIFVDWFFIPSYTLAFVGAAWLGYRKAWGVKPLVIAAVACIAIAAAFDVRENLAILRLVGEVRFEPSDEPALATRHASMIKWAAIFATCALIAPLYLFRPMGQDWTGWIPRAAGMLFAAASLDGFHALLDNRLIPRASGLIALGFLVLFAFHALIRPIDQLVRRRITRRVAVT